MAQREVRFKNTLPVIKYTHINVAALAEYKSPTLKGRNYCPISSMYTDVLQNVVLHFLITSVDMNTAVKRISSKT